MTTNELARLKELIDALSDTDRQELAYYLNEKTTSEGNTDIHGRASNLFAAAEKMNFSSGQTDVSERSREILSSQF